MEPVEKQQLPDPGTAATTRGNGRVVPAAAGSSPAVDPDHDSPSDSGLFDIPADGASGLPHVEGYQLISKLGKGGMGTVWRALQLGTRRHIALKITEVEKVKATDIARFTQEVQIAARLEHPHIAQIYDSRVYQGTYCFAMELVEGLSLGRHILENKVDLRGRLQLMSKVCRAIHYAHTRGVIHRDIKPSNILVTPEGEPKVVDFGLAKVLAGFQSNPASALTVDGTSLGTPAFMSPEQAMGQGARIDARSDVFSLGIVLYLVVLGEHPFGTEGNPFQIMQRVIHQPVKPPREVSRHVPADLETIILKTLEKVPEERYTTALEVADDIDRFLRNEPIQGGAPLSRFRVRRNLVKYRSGLLLVLLGVLAIGGAGLAAVDIARNRYSKPLETAGMAAEARLRGFFDPVAQNLILIQSLGRTAVFDPSDIASCNRVLVPILAQIPAVRSLTAVDPEGSAYLLIQEGDEWKAGVATRATEGWGVQTQWMRFRDAGSAPLSQWEQHLPYDARRSTWYLEAIEGMDPVGVDPSASQSDRIVWTKPYAMPLSTDAGITAAMRVVRPDGKVFVVALDVLLDDISSFTSSMDVAPEAQVMLLSNEGVVMGLGRETRDRPVKLRSEPGLGAAAVAAPVATEMLRAWREATPSRRHDPVRFEMNGQPVWAGFRRFSLAQDQLAWIGVAVPEGDLLRTLPPGYLVVAAAIVLALMMVVAGFHLITRKHAISSISPGR